MGFCTSISGGWPWEFFGPSTASASRNPRYLAPKSSSTCSRWQKNGLLVFSRLMKKLVVFYQAIWKIWGPKFRGENQQSLDTTTFPFHPLVSLFLTGVLNPYEKPQATNGGGEAVDVLPSSKTNRKIWWYGPVASSVAGGGIFVGGMVGWIISNKWIISLVKQQVFVAYVAFTSRINLSIFYIWTFWTIWFYPAQQRSSRICDHDPWGVIASNEQLGIFRRSHRLTLGI